MSSYKEFKKTLLTDDTSPPQPTKQSLAPGLSNMEAALTAPTSLIQSGKTYSIVKQGTLC